MSGHLYHFPDTVDDGIDVTGYEVHAIDGLVGTVETVTVDAGHTCLIVDTDFWIVGEKRLLPAGIVRAVRQDTQTAFIGIGKDELRNAPEYDEQQHDNDALAYLENVGRYYAPWAPLRGPTRAWRVVIPRFHSAEPRGR